LESVGQTLDIVSSVLTVWLESKVVIIGGMIFLNSQGEHNQAFNFAPVGRRTCYARLLTNRYVAGILSVVSKTACGQY
jgi:hypothetical protein